MQRFVDDHTGHSAALGGFITEAGGEEFACANPWLARRVIDPIFEALDGKRRPVARRAQHRPGAREPRRRVVSVTRRIAHHAGPQDEDDADRGRREPPRGDARAVDHRHARRVREPGVARRAGRRRRNPSSPSSTPSRRRSEPCRRSSSSSGLRTTRVSGSRSSSRPRPPTRSSTPIRAADRARESEPYTDPCDGESAGWPRHGGGDAAVSRKVGTPPGRVLARARSG